MLRSAFSGPNISRNFITDDYGDYDIKYGGYPSSTSAYTNFWGTDIRERFGFKGISNPNLHVPGDMQAASVNKVEQEPLLHEEDIFYKQEKEKEDYIEYYDGSDEKVVPMLIDHPLHPPPQYTVNTLWSLRTTNTPVFLPKDEYNQDSTSWKKDSEDVFIMIGVVVVLIVLLMIFL